MMLGLGRKLGSALTGYVTGLALSSEGSQNVWRFRLAQGTTPENLTYTQIELRAKHIEGFINENDLVVVTKGKQKDGILYTKELWNETTHLEVKDK
jgi:hypothetical protein